MLILKRAATSAPASNLVRQLRSPSNMIVGAKPEPKRTWLSPRLLHANRSDVIERLGRTGPEHGILATPRIDQGAESLSRDLDLWCESACNFYPVDRGIGFQN